MADWNLVSQPESFGLQFERMAAQIRCAMPGIILEFDPALQTAAVQPALKMKVNLGDEQKHLELPVVQNVPVMLPFAQGAGLLLTLPLGPGDECLLVFSDRARRVFLSLGPDGIVISDGSGSFSLCNGRLEINTPGGCGQPGCGQSRPHSNGPAAAGNGADRGVHPSRIQPVRNRRSVSGMGGRHGICGRRAHCPQPGGVCSAAEPHRPEPPAAGQRGDAWLSLQSDGDGQGGGDDNPPDGSRERPYAFIPGMDVYADNYYTHADALYLAKADMLPCVWPPDTPGLWQWEAVEQND